MLPVYTPVTAIEIDVKHEKVPVKIADAFSKSNLIEVDFDFQPC
jgi:hypothetical protein